MNDFIIGISSLNGITPLKTIEPGEMQSGIGELGKGKDFSSFLQDAVAELNKTQQDSVNATTALVTGQIDDFHTPIIAMEKASLTLGVAVTVRNKVLDAYHEIMRMQI